MTRASERANGKDRSQSSPPRTSPAPLDPQRFDQLYASERALCERNDRSLALLVIESVDDDPDALDEILEVLAERISAPDTLGLIDRRRAGILMPETNPWAARRPASEQITALAKAGLRANCVLYADAVAPPQSGDSDSTASGILRAAAQNAKANGGQRLADAGPQGEINLSGSIEDLSEIRHRPDIGWTRDIALLDVKPLPLWKRALDVVFSAVLLVLLMPLFLVVALAIRLTSRGPILFSQPRVGLGGRVFEFYKFRTMYLDADRRKAELEAANEQTGPIFKMKKDPRITPIGRFLRKSSIDEMPQLWNVLRGDMTLVGPRPPIVSEVEKYERWQLARLNISGGLTCTWQVNGRSEIGFTDWVRMDIKYARDRSWRKDLRILIKTLRAVITGRGAY